MKILFELAGLIIAFGGALLVFCSGVYVAAELCFHLRERFEDWRR